LPLYAAGGAYRGGARWNDPRFLGVLGAYTKHVTKDDIDFSSSPLLVPAEGEASAAEPVVVYGAEVAFVAATVSSLNVGVFLLVDAPLVHYLQGFEQFAVVAARIQ
jgi:hypothetical protein